MIKKLVIPFSNSNENEIDLLLLINSIYSIKKSGYEFLFVTEKSYWNIIKNRLSFIVSENELLFIDNAYDFYYGVYKFNYYKYLIENWSDDVLIIDHDTYLNGKFVEPDKYDIFCQAFNRNAHHDIRYINKISKNHDEVKSINAGILKFNNVDILNKYYEIVNDKSLNFSNIMYYEQILPAIHLNCNWSFYHDNEMVNAPYWYEFTNKMNCNIDFTNVENQYCHFMGNIKQDKFLLSLLKDNLSNILNLSYTGP